MSKTKKGNGKHLTYSDRAYIEQELLQNSSFRSISATLGKDPSTISKEVRLHSKKVPSYHDLKRCSLCKSFKECTDMLMICLECDKDCWHCDTNHQVAKECSKYNPFTCPKLVKPPYVCNGCEKRNYCREAKRFYRAKQAQKDYEKTLSETRSGINMTSEELRQLNELVSPLILKGQPLSHIFAVPSDEIPVCRRTLYNYLDQRVFFFFNIGLSRRVRYKPRKKKTSPRTREIIQVYRNKRTYKDFEHFMEAHPDLDVVEMDTVKGGNASGKCLLTLLFRSCNFMLVILLIVSGINLYVTADDIVMYEGDTLRGWQVDAYWSNGQKNISVVSDVSQQIDVKLTVSYYAPISSMTKALSPGTVSFSIPNIGSVRRSGAAFVPITAADQTDSDWNCTYNAETDSYIFTNKNTFEADKPLSGGFEMLWHLNTRECMNGYERIENPI